MSDPTLAISIKNLTKVFRTPTVRKQFVTAVQDLSLEVAAGQIYGLIGPNGSGKSTTMKVLLGLLKPTAGTAAIFGRDSSRVESRNDVGFLPENPYFYKHLTGAETLAFYGKLCGRTCRLSCPTWACPSSLPILCLCPLSFVEWTLRSTTQGLGQELTMVWAERGLKSSESQAVPQEKPSASFLPGPGHCLPGSLHSARFRGLHALRLFGLKPLFCIA